MQVQRAITETLKGGLVNGPTLYITQKLVSSVDAAGSNVLPKAVPQELRTPLVGLVLGALPLMVSDHWLAEKVSEYSMANAVAQTLALAGNGGTGAPGVIDQAVNSVFDKVAALGAPAPGTGTNGYISQRNGTNGYMVQKRATQGYLPNAPMAGLRQPMRGLTTELHTN